MGFCDTLFIEKYTRKNYMLHHSLKTRTVQTTHALNHSLSSNCRKKKKKTNQKKKTHHILNRLSGQKHPRYNLRQHIRRELFVATTLNKKSNPIQPIPNPQPATTHIQYRSERQGRAQPMIPAEQPVSNHPINQSHSQPTTTTTKGQSPSASHSSQPKGKQEYVPSD